MAKHPRSYGGASPLTSNPVRHLDFKIQELAPDLQANKLRASINKNANQIKKLIQRKFREPSNAQEIEAKIGRIEALMNWKQFKVGMKEKKVRTQDRKYETQKENLKAEMNVHIKNLGKIKPNYNPKSAITPEHQGNIDQIFGKQKPEVKRVGNTTKLVRKKRFART